MTGGSKSGTSRGPSRGTRSTWVGPEGWDGGGKDGLTDGRSDVRDVGLWTSGPNNNLLAVQTPNNNLFGVQTNEASGVSLGLLVTGCCETDTDVVGRRGVSRPPNPSSIRPPSFDPVPTRKGGPPTRSHLRLPLSIPSGPTVLSSLTRRVSVSGVS